MTRKWLRIPSQSNFSSFQMRTNIQGTFDQVRRSLNFRETLLIRQLQVLEKQTSHLTKDIQFIPENETLLLQLIRAFGKFNVQHLNICDDFLSTEDYICPQDDHILINKQLIADDTPPSPQSPPQIDGTANNVNEALINLILSESKELISMSQLREKRVDGEVNKERSRHGNKSTTSKLQIGDTKAEATATTAHANNKSSVKRTSVDSTKEKNVSLSQSKKFIPNLKSTVCGSVNLLRRPTAIAAPPVVDYELQPVTCDFYKRLINENKLLRPPVTRRSTANQTSLRVHPQQQQQQQQQHSPITPTSSSSSSTSFKEFSASFERKLLWDDDNDQDGLPSVTDANGNDVLVVLPSPTTIDRPKQIQSWLKQIIQEPELEPMENNEFLETSRIKTP